MSKNWNQSQSEIILVPVLSFCAKKRSWTTKTEVIKVLLLFVFCRIVNLSFLDNDIFFSVNHASLLLSCCVAQAVAGKKQNIKAVYYCWIDTFLHAIVSYKCFNVDYEIAISHLILASKLNIYRVTKQYLFKNRKASLDI